MVPGDSIECSNSSGFSSDTFIVVNYIDTRRRMGYNKKRRRRKSRGKGRGRKNRVNKDIKNGDCVGRFATDCSVQLIGLSAEKCNDLFVVSYVDGEGQYCDATVLAEDDNMP